MDSYESREAQRLEIYDSKQKFMKLVTEHNLIQMINPIKLEFINSLASLDKSIIPRKVYANERLIYSTNAIMGYTLKNIDTRDLIYAKAIYKNGKITYEKATVKPGEKFIITRHEVDALGFLNGYGIGKEIKEGRHEWTIVTGYRKYTNTMPGYIRYNGIEGETVHSDMYKVSLYEYTDSGHVLKAEYKERFSWLEDSTYCKKISRRDNYVSPEDQELRKHGALLDERDFTDYYYGDYAEPSYNLIIRGNTSQEQIDNLVNKLKVMGKSPEVETRIHRGAGEITYVQFKDNNEKSTMYIFSQRPLIIKAKHAFRGKNYGTLDLSGVTLYADKLAHIFFASTFEKLVIGNVKNKDKSLDDLNKIFYGLGECNNILSPNPILQDRIKQSLEWQKTNR